MAQADGGIPAAPLHRRRTDGVRAPPPEGGWIPDVVDADGDSSDSSPGLPPSPVAEDVEVFLREVPNVLSDDATEKAKNGTGRVWDAFAEVKGEAAGKANRGGGRRGILGLFGRGGGKAVGASARAATSTNIHIEHAPSQGRSRLTVYKASVETAAEGRDDGDGGRSNGWVLSPTKVASYSFDAALSSDATDVLARGSWRLTVGDAIRERIANLERASPRLVEAAAGMGTVREVKRENVELGRLVQRGRFSIVYDIAALRGEGGSSSEGESSGPLPARCVMKYLRPGIDNEPVEFVAGAMKLALEAKILSSLCHENIIQLCGISEGSVTAAFSPSSSVDAYFLLMEKVQVSLEARMDRWRDEERRHAIAAVSGSRDDASAGTAKPEQIPTGRCRATWEIARGMEYLHSLGIMYRNLSPANIGFNAGGTVKIFDFSCAREAITPTLGSMFWDKQEGRKPTGVVGTFRYMAPEVHLSRWYGLPADVYSFGLLLWEMWALEPPFDGYSYKEMKRRVVREGERPATRSSWPAAVQFVMEHCWSSDPSKRPSFDVVLAILMGDVGPAYLGVNNSVLVAAVINEDENEDEDEDATMKASFGSRQVDGDESKKKAADVVEKVVSKNIGKPNREMEFNAKANGADKGNGRANEVAKGFHIVHGNRNGKGERAKDASKGSTNNDETSTDGKEPLPQQTKSKPTKLTVFRTMVGRVGMSPSDSIVWALDPNISDGAADCTEDDEECECSEAPPPAAPVRSGAGDTVNPAPPPPAVTVDAWRRAVADAVWDRVAAFECSSHLRDAPQRGKIRTFSRGEIAVGALLGRGRFNDVYDGGILWQGADDRPGGGDGAVLVPGKCAVKHLSPSALDVPNRLMTGAIDLALEARILSSLRHDNVIQLFGVAADSRLTSFASGQADGYFLVEEKVRDTLADRILVWRNEDLGHKLAKAASSHKSRRDAPRPDTTDDPQWRALLRRLQAAHGIAEGMRYLHGLGIIHRDLHPTNIGFDSRGTVKIFDLGSAREVLPPHGDDKSGQGGKVRKHTGVAGTLPYMAPEVCKFEPHGLGADVYSFGMLLWEICALECPFKELSQSEIEKRVVAEKHRPEVDESWPASISYLMKQCWSDNPSVRPSFDGVLAVIMGDNAIQQKEGKPELAVKKEDKYSTRGDEEENGGILNTLILPKGNNTDSFSLKSSLKQIGIKQLLTQCGQAKCGYDQQSQCQNSDITSTVTEADRVISQTSSDSVSEKIKMESTGMIIAAQGNTEIHVRDVAQGNEEIDSYVEVIPFFPPDSTHGDENDQGFVNRRPEQKGKAVRYEEREKKMAQVCLPVETSLKRSETERHVKSVHRDDIVIGKLLCCGQFSDFFEMSAWKSSDINTVAEEYMVKILHQPVMDDPDQSKACAIDLAHEAEILSSLNHKNIIKLHGVASIGYFLVLERIKGTLSDLFTAWKKQEKRQFAITHRMSKRKSSRALYNSYRLGVMHRRLFIATSIADGMQFLHSLHIAHLDLIPKNIGFDSEDTIKILNFRAARRLLPDGDGRKPTGMVGTLGYMAPEVYRCEQYGLKADVFSFGILLWEMLALECPFNKLSRRNAEMFIPGKHQLPLDSSWPASSQYLMKRCWSDDPIVRPSFDGVLAVMKGDVSLIGRKMGKGKAKFFQDLVLRRLDGQKHNSC